MDPRRQAGLTSTRGAGALLALLLAACADPPRPYRHVVLVSLDTTRADHLGCYESERARTPRLDELARAGAVFLDTTSPAPTTLAAHTSLVTGLAPRSHGVPRNHFVIDDSNRTLAEILRDAGWRTAAFLGSFALDREFGFDQGFEHFDAEFDVLFTPGGADQNQRRAEQVTDAALSWARAHADEPLFLFVHYFDPHAPYDPPPPWGERANPGGPASSDADDVERAVVRHQEAALGAGAAPGQAAVITGGLPAELLARAAGRPLPGDEDLARLYAGEVEYLDHHIGRLLDGLGEAGLLDDALVVVTADHGETFWEHADAWNHGLWVYDTTVRVPLIVRAGDGRGAGRRVDAPVSTLDVLPTLLELLELPVPAEVEGRSLVPALDGSALAAATLVSEATQPASAAFEQGRAWANDLKPKAVRDGPWKYVVAPYLGREELFRVDRDPLEQRNLLGSGDPAAEPERARLRRALERWVAERSPRPTRRNDAKLLEIRERLRALGYVEDPALDEER